MTQPASPTASTSSGVAALQAVFSRHLRQGWPIPLVALLAAIVERLWRAPEPVAWPPLLIATVASTTPIVLGAAWVDAGTPFVLARPVPWWAWWGGRAAASLLLLALAVGLLGVPASFTAAPLESASLTVATESLIAFTFSALAVAFISALRAGSVVGALGAVLAAGAFFLALGAGTSPDDGPDDSLLAIGAIGAFGALAASAAGVASGRADRRATAAAAVAAWCACALPVAAWGAWRWAYPLPPPALTDLWRAEVAHATGDGQWLHVGGFMDGEGRRRPDFLVHAGSGRWQRLPTVWNRLLAFDHESRRMAWIEYGGGNGANPALVVAALEDQGGLVVERRHALEYRQPRFDALILRGNRVAIVAPEWVQLRDADSGAALATAVRSGPQRLAALTGDGALVFARDAVTGGFDVRDVEVMRLREGQGEEVLMTVRELVRGDSLSLCGDGRRLVVGRVDRRAPPLQRPRTTVTLYDVQRGTELASIDVPQAVLSTGVLADGRAIVAGRSPDRRVFVATLGDRASPAIAEVGEDAGAVLLGGEVAPGIVALGITTSTADTTQTLLVDVDAARVVRSLPGVAPLVRFRFPLDEDAWRSRAPRQAFFLGPSGVVAIDGAGAPLRTLVESTRAAEWLQPAR